MAFVVLFKRRNLLLFGGIVASVAFALIAWRTSAQERNAFIDTPEGRMTLPYSADNSKIPDPPASATLLIEENAPCDGDTPQGRCTPSVGTAQGNPAEPQPFSPAIVDSNPLTVSGTTGDDTLVLTATNSTDGSYTLNGEQPVSFTGVTSFNFSAGAGNDTFTINNPAGSLFAPVGGIGFNGGGQSGDSLVLSGGGGAGFTETYFVGTTIPPIGGGPGSPGDGEISFNGPAPVDIRFTGLAPIVDTVTAASLTVDSTDAANVIQVTNGGVAPRLRVAVDSFEPIDFSNKTSLTVNGGDGTLGGDVGDTITINYTNAPAGLSSMFINGNEGNDTITVLARSGAYTLTLNGNEDNDTIDASAIGIGFGPIAFNGNDGNDALIGSAGNDSMDGGQGNDTFIGNGGTDNIGGGVGTSVFDQIIVPGTTGNDTIALAPDGSGHLVVTINGVTTTYQNFIGTGIDTAGIESVLVNGDDGNDTITDGFTSSSFDTTLNGGNGDDTLDASATLAGPKSIALNGNDGDDTLIGGADDDTMDGGAGNDRFVGNGGTDNIGAGVPSAPDDRIVVPGTGAADTITLTVNGSGHLLATINGVTTTYRNFIGGTIDTSGIHAVDVNAGSANDTISVTPLNVQAINVDGGSPVLPTLPGDTLSINFAGTTGAAFTPGAPGAGTITFTNRGTVSYVSIETPPLGTTAATVTVAGRVLTADGAGLRNAVVTITDVGGRTRVTSTGAFGYFSFSDVRLGNQVLGIRSRRFHYRSRIIDVKDQISDLKFYPDQ